MVKDKSMRKIGIIGGTFNPIHLAHLLIAETAREEASLEKVIFVPSGCSYLKDPAEIANQKDRLNMVKLATASNPCFTVSTIEIERKGNSYTYETLSALQKQYADAQLYLIMGADNLFSMEEWKAPERIFDACHILVTVRDDKDTAAIHSQIAHLQDTFGAKADLLPFQKIDLSSTVIREHCRLKKSVRYLVPDPVLDYIEGHHLYQEHE